MDRNEAIRRIREGLKARSGKSWSVTGGRGTAWGWITIDVPPRREASRAEELRELGVLLGNVTIHSQGVSVAASNAHYTEYVDRAEGRTPKAIAQPYWD